MGSIPPGAHSTVSRLKALGLLRLPTASPWADLLSRLKALELRA